MKMWSLNIERWCCMLAAFVCACVCVCPWSWQYATNNLGWDRLRITNMSLSWRLNSVSTNSLIPLFLLIFFFFSFHPLLFPVEFKFHLLFCYCSFLSFPLLLLLRFFFCSFSVCFLCFFSPYLSILERIKAMLPDNGLWSVNMTHTLYLQNVKHYNGRETESAL